MSDVTSTSATTQPVTVYDVKRQLNVSSTDDDQYIRDLIRSATDMVEKRTNSCFITQTRTLKMQDFDDRRYVHADRDGREQIYLPRSPLATVSSITYVASDGTTSTLGTTVYTASTGDTPGRIFESYNQNWPDTRSVPDNVTVTYTCGYGTTQSAVPENAKQAIRQIVAHWYRNREAVMVGTITKEMELGVDALLSHETLPNYG